MFAILSIQTRRIALVKNRALRFLLCLSCGESNKTNFNTYKPLSYLGLFFVLFSISWSSPFFAIGITFTSICSENICSVFRFSPSFVFLSLNLVPRVSAAGERNRVLWVWDCLSLALDPKHPSFQSTRMHRDTTIRKSAQGRPLGLAIDNGGTITFMS